MKILLYKFIKPEFVFPFIANGRIKLSCLGETNDPFEYIPSLDFKRKFEEFLSKNSVACNALQKLDISGELGKLANLFAKQRNDIDPYASFSLNCSGPLLWGHYADNHRGACLVFEMEFDGEKGSWPGSLLRLIHYSQKRFSLWLLFMCRDCPDIFPSVRALMNYRGCTEKSLDWSYEQELRVFVIDKSQIVTRNEIPFYCDARPFLKGIILGAQSKISISEVNEELKLFVKEQEVKVCKAIISQEEYKVENDSFPDVSDEVYQKLKNCFYYPEYENFENAALKVGKQCMVEKLAAIMEAAKTGQMPDFLKNDDEN